MIGGISQVRCFPYSLSGLSWQETWLDSLMDWRSSCSSVRCNQLNSWYWSVHVARAQRTDQAPLFSPQLPLHWQQAMAKSFSAPLKARWTASSFDQPHHTALYISSITFSMETWRGLFRWSQYLPLALFTSAWKRKNWMVSHLLGPYHQFNLRYILIDLSQVTLSSLHSVFAWLDWERCLLESVD